jgi:hypothetical protein
MMLSAHTAGLPIETKHPARHCLVASGGSSGPQAGGCHSGSSRGNEQASLEPPSY